MKKHVLFLALIVLVTTSCERVAPNYYGVLMENYGKNGKEDYSKQQGRVTTISPGTELFQVPGFEQRGQFENEDSEGSELPTHARGDGLGFGSQHSY